MLQTVGQSGSSPPSRQLQICQGTVGYQKNELQLTLNISHCPVLYQLMKSTDSRAASWTSLLEGVAFPGSRHQLCSKVPVCVVSEADNPNPNTNPGTAALGPDPSLAVQPQGTCCTALLSVCLSVLPHTGIGYPADETVTNLPV